MLNHQNNKMETTVIRLEPSSATDNLMVRNASFEEAFGDYSESAGGRARRKKRRLERIANRREVKTARRGIKADRQKERIERRATRKAGRQDIRANQLQARQTRRASRTEQRAGRRQMRVDAKQVRKDTRATGEQDRENYATEQEAYRNQTAEEQGAETTDQQGGGYDDQQGASNDQQGGGSQEDWNAQPSGMDSQWDNSGNQGGGSQGSGYSEDGGADYSEPQYEEEGAYGDDNRYDSPYVQEESEFADDSNFSGEAMDGKVVVSPKVKETANKLKNNEQAFKDLNDRRNLMVNRGDNTRGIDNEIKKCHGRIGELHSYLEDYANADGNPQERRRRRKEINVCLGRGKRMRKPQPQGGSETPVDKNLNPDFSSNKIEIPATTNFDGFDDLGREVIINGVSQSDYSDYTNDFLNDGEEPTTIGLYSSFDGKSKIGANTNVILSVLVGVSIGALAIYLAKKKGWI